MSYTLIGTRQSRAFRALWLLEEIGADYAHVPAAPRSDEVTRVSALGKIPVLVDGETVVPDSSAILTYLADRHAALTFPAGTPERARQDAWTFRILDELDALLWTAARHSFVLPEAARVPAVKDSLKGEFAANLERLTAEIPGPFLMGETMTVPDIVLVHCGGWAVSAKFPEPPAAFKDYARGLRARPAYARASEKS
ncbi:glutathione S-transferase family protein [Roseivivax isoporae]|uniref:Glutathione S-transferase n=1 Tax=Roseivivax isoporae LMG 25204 TaxID=1449351 RepID=X7FD70_9RHOB|nr:glutathione S-transferase [Roseivivax isoporae]ETX29994.1 glutathione S-transferase [Roseivivax isoporae LMG 25204]